MNRSSKEDVKIDHLSESCCKLCVNVASSLLSSRNLWNNNESGKEVRKSLEEYLLRTPTPTMSSIYHVDTKDSK